MSKMLRIVVFFVLVCVCGSGCVTIEEDRQQNKKMWNDHLKKCAGHIEMFIEEKPELIKTIQGTRRYPDAYFKVDGRIFMCQQIGSCDFSVVLIGRVGAGVWEL